MYTDDSVTKDQSGWDFTVKRVATIINEDSAAHTVSTFSLTIGVGASKRSYPPLGCFKR